MSNRNQVLRHAQAGYKCSLRVSAVPVEVYLNVATGECVEYSALPEYVTGRYGVVVWHAGEDYGLADVLAWAETYSQAREALRRIAGYNPLGALVIRVFDGLNLSDS